MGGSGSDTSAGSFDRLRTRGAKPQQERRDKPSSRQPPVHNRIEEDRDTRDTIKVRRYAQAKLLSPKRWEGSPAKDRFGP
jgi:hypothetical protein